MRPPVIDFSLCHQPLPALVFDANGVAHLTYGAAVPDAPAESDSNVAANTRFVKASRLPVVLDVLFAPMVGEAERQLIVPFDCTLVEWTLLADQEGSVSLAVLAGVYASYPFADTIANPSIEVDIKNQGVENIELNAGDILRIAVLTVTTIEQATLFLKLVPR